MLQVLHFDKIDVSKLMLIKQVHQKSLMFVTIGIS